MPTIQIKAKHVHASKGFLSNYYCPLANAAKEHFNNQNAHATPSGIYLIPGNIQTHAYLTRDSYYGLVKYKEDKLAAQNADPEKVIRELEYILVKSHPM